VESRKSLELVGRFWKEGQIRMSQWGVSMAKKTATISVQKDLAGGRRF
jgi:hypothetical protein